MAVFIDEANIYHSQKTLKWKVDYFKLKRFLRNNFNIVFINFYTSYIETNRNQNNLLMALRQDEINIIKKKLKTIKTRSGLILKGNLDVEIALDMYINNDEYDVAFLFSGDSDFSYVLKRLKDLEKKVVVFSTGGHIARELVVIANRYTDLKKIKKYIILNQQTPRKESEGS